ncbi:Hypothetical predicted protein [Paramuricea clavata]|uniref:Uncharacterized protein n=1 Tax=Paramuricea clavata TaxID=317549 RepID=A0A7D9LCC9_PARCT|nr:Hypothetical predicted protein [Paramuricea clavata]
MKLLTKNCCILAAILFLWMDQMNCVPFSKQEGDRCPDGKSCEDDPSVCSTACKYGEYKCTHIKLQNKHICVKYNPDAPAANMVTIQIPECGTQPTPPTKNIPPVNTAWKTTEFQTTELVIPITTESVPITTESVPITTESFPTTESIPITTESIPITTEAIPITTESLPITTESTPVISDQIPITTDKSSLTIFTIPSPTKPPFNRPWAWSRYHPWKPRFGKNRKNKWNRKRRSYSKFNRLQRNRKFW